MMKSPDIIEPGSSRKFTGKFGKTAEMCQISLLSTLGKTF
jgi:hypothetical protein